MTELHITRGLPGSGKTTHARAWVDADHEHRARINRDDLRNCLHDGYRGKATEQQITIAAHAAIAALLAEGINVICDDTNLTDQHVDQLAYIAHRSKAQVVIVDLRDVPLEVCLAQNAKRTGRARLKAKRIREMHARLHQPDPPAIAGTP